MSKSWLKPALAFGAVTAGAAILGTLATRTSVDSAWYRRLRKPPFQPPRRAFGPVWTALYAMMAASAVRIWNSPPSPERSRALRLWTTQLALNAGWSAIFFAARRPRVALVEITALLATIAAYARQAGKVDRGAAALIAPYLGWTAFATALNEEIARRNP
jgi:tryptophan-rich sensory protein